MSLEAARTVHFWITIGLLLYLAHLALVAIGRRSWTLTLFLGAALILSLPGRFILGAGQTTVLTTIGVLNAWLWRDKPLVAGAWLALAVFKPVIGLPIAAVFLAARYVKPVLWSAAVTVVLSIPILAVCMSASGGVGGFVDSIQRNLDYFANNPQVRPNSIVRVDLTSFIARVFDIDMSTSATVVISVAVFAVLLFVVWRTAPVGQGLDILCVGITGVLLVGYQPTYHTILLTPVVVWIGTGASTIFTRRWVLAGLVAFAMLNPFASVAFSHRFEQGSHRFIGLLGAPLCCACVAVAFALLSLDLLRAARRQQSEAFDPALTPQPTATSSP
jgi:hypothetical protein